MLHTLDAFAARVHAILQNDNTPAGRDMVAMLLGELLDDRAFIDSLFDDQSPERKVIYEDPQLGFCILAHQYKGAKDGGPHDHGPSWAIYGQADGETIMSDWTLIGEAEPGQPAPVKKLREYTLTPGVAHVYNEGDIHAPNRTGPTRLIRIEGMNLERVARGKYQPVWH